MAFMLADLGVTQSHLRPHLANDNLFSESRFKTLEYRSDFPRRFRIDRVSSIALSGLLQLV